jgi:DNA-binding beta-propeller fold protein YncE
MAETFKCPSCAAPLEFEGKPMQKCPFCGSSVIVPSEMFYPPAGRNANVDFASLTGRALKIAEIQREIQRGNKINAIKIFRETFGTGLKEAKDAVEAMERGESVDISGMQVQSVDLRANPETLDAVKKAGFAIGGSILGTVLLVTLFIVGMIVAIFYFTFSSVNRHLSTLPTPGSRGNTSVTTPTPDAEEVLKFGGEGTGAGKFKDNRHVAVDGKGFMYSADYSGGRIQVFDPDGKFVTQWTAEAGMNLYDMAADRKGNVYIANNKGVSMFEGETGKLLNKSDSYYIQGMARALDGKLIVSMGRGLAILGPDLKPIQEFKDASERASTTGNFREIAVDGNNNIYALDSHNGDICKFSADGKFLNRIPTGASSPNGIAIAPSGRIFVSDVSSILVFDENGQKVKSFRATQAFGMAFNDAGELFVASRPYVVKYKLNF